MTDRPLSLTESTIRALLARQKTQHRTTLTLSQEGKPSTPVAATADIVTLNDGVDWRHGRCHVRDARGLTAAFEIGVAVGDRLWVREEWRALKVDDDKSGPELAEDFRRRVSIQQRRSEPRSIPVLFPAHGATQDDVGPEWGRIRTHKTLPQSASRFTLLVSDVRIHRLREMSEIDAAAEGVDQTSRGGVVSARDYRTHGAWFFKTGDLSETMLRRSFESLWDSSHRESRWNDNPWVVCRTFECKEANIEDIDRVH